MTDITVEVGDFEILVEQINAAGGSRVDDANFIGGWRVVADYTARDAIQTNLRKEGMRVYVVATQEVFQLESDLTTWVEVSSGYTASSAGLGDQTTSNITVTIDPNLPNSAGRPTADTVFRNQTDVDAWLAAQTGSPTGFAHPMSFYDFLAGRIVNTVTLNCSADVFRPNGITSQGFAFKSKVVDQFSGSVVINGETNTSNWTQVHAGGTVQSHTATGNTPNLVFPASTFPNDSSLVGAHIVLDNGFNGVIRKHNDTTLWLCRDISPAVTDGVTTGTVREPITEFRNTVDDIATYGSTNVLVDCTDTGNFTFNAIKFNGAGGNGQNVFIRAGFVFGFDCLIDGRDNVLGSNGWGILVRPSNPFTAVGFFDSAVISDPTSSEVDAAAVIDRAGELNFFNSVIAGNSERGLSVENQGILKLQGCAVQGVGQASDASGAVEVFQEGQLQFFASAGFTSRIEATPSTIPGLYLSRNGYIGLLSFASSTLYFQDNLGPCVQLDEGGQVDFQSINGSGFVDAGGNTDVGLDLVGQGSKALLNTGSNVTGTSGDVRVNGSIYTYANITAPSGPVTDLQTLNVIERL